jgi:fused signal recognition particle receptor
MDDVWLVAASAAAAVAAVSALVFRLRARRRAASARHDDVAGVTEARDRLRDGLRATGRRLAGQIADALGRAPQGLDAALDALGEVLIAADVGARVSRELVERIRRRSADATPEALQQALRDEIVAVLEAPPPPEPTEHPWVILVTGVNGVGKTTTVGKLAARHAAVGRRVLVVAADTFRAAAIDQLAVWAERAGAELVRQAPGSDPSAVVFDGIKAAVARHVDVVLVDTAGRLHTRSNLMDELRKVRRVVARELPGAPHETLLVIDATTGQNALAQARTFAEAVDVTGIVLTKLDGTAKGGVALALRRELGVPLRYVGVGESVEDLRPFEAAAFVDALFDAGPAGFP